jgi:hypothetical protein
LIFKVIFALSELESVEYLRQSSASSFLSPITLNSNLERLFTYFLVGRQCNYTWTILKKIYTTNSTFENVDTELNLCTRINYPYNDQATSNDGLLFF